MLALSLIRRLLLLLPLLGLVPSHAALQRWSVRPGLAMGPGVSLEGEDALWRAIEQATPGSILEVSAGEYPPGTLGKRGPAPRGTRKLPITVRAMGRVVVKPQGWGGGATLTVYHGEWVTFEGFLFEASGSGIFFMPKHPGGQLGWHFLECEIDGMWDWKAGRSRHPTGLKTKWGISSWGLGDFLWEGGSIHDIYWEHGMYHRSPVGDIVVRGATIERVGRTAMQVRCPASQEGQGELEPGRGRILVQVCKLRDTGLSDGGSSLTLAGRNNFTSEFSSNLIEYGFDRELRAAWERAHPGKRYGSGAIAVWSERPGWKNGPLTVSGNQIRYAQGCGDRPAVMIGSTPKLYFRDNRVLVADPGAEGSHGEAVLISPRRPDRPELPRDGYSDVGVAHISGNQVSGRFQVKGVPYQGE